MKIEKAIFSGGCFWCIQSAFDKVRGVIKTVAGYTGGTTANPTYKEVSMGGTDHLEAVEISFDPEKISYRDLLEVLFKNIDPTDAGGQFADRGTQYATAIFYLNDDQKKQAETAIENLSKSSLYDKPIVTKIIKESIFYPAEEHHQKYYEKAPSHYQAYNVASGRAQYIEEKNKEHMQSNLNCVSCSSLTRNHSKFKQHSSEDLKKKLTALQYAVTQAGATEAPFQNKYWDNNQEGIYVDIVSGEPLFSSNDKFDSGSGWPSFTKPIEKNNLLELDDNSHGMHRIEIKSRHAFSHLGHLFYDGPQPSGIRYCINSASLRFIPKDQLEKEGYGEYAKLFK